MRGADQSFEDGEVTEKGGELQGSNATRVVLDGGAVRMCEEEGLCGV